MAILFFVLSVTAFAAVVPLTSKVQQTWWTQLWRTLDRWIRRAAPAAPPSISHEAGWTLIHCDDPAIFNQWLGHDEEGLPFREGEQPSLGSHLLVELFDCDAKSLEEETSVRGAMLRAAEDSQATVVEESFHEFKPYGVSGAVIIQESHYTIHTWPEHKYAAVDLFYCGGTVHVHRAIEVLQQRFQPKRMKFLVVRRGVQSEVIR